MRGKDWLKARAASLLGRRELFRSFCRDSVCVFLYHDCSDAPSAFSRRYELNVPPALFARQLAWIRRSFTLISIDELLAGDFPTPAALVTFDDGLPGFFRGAAPLLARDNAPATIFLNMEPVDGAPFWAGLATYLCDEVPEFRRAIAGRLDPGKGPAFLQVRHDWAREFLDGRDRAGLLGRVREFHGGFASPADLERAAGRAGIRFGNHLLNHFNAGALGETELAEAFLENRRRLAAYPNAVDAMSYPFGVEGLCYNESTNALLIGLGARALFSAKPLPNRAGDGPLLHRIGLDESVRTEEDLLFRALWPALKSRAWSAS